ncbi:MAG: agmatinase, partial [Methylobacteriaceae bacterium]|nr:agmatinase [Methylobacteriaceae bacterium]
MTFEEKLARLRAKYLTARGGDIYDPEYARVAAQQFRDG